MFIYCVIGSSLASDRGDILGFTLTPYKHTLGDGSVDKPLLPADQIRGIWDQPYSTLLEGASLHKPTSGNTDTDLSVATAPGLQFSHTATEINPRGVIVRHNPNACVQ
jgi:hypothetical protein